MQVLFANAIIIANEFNKVILVLEIIISVIRFRKEKSHFNN